MFHICENNKVEPGRKVYVSSLHTILPKVLSFHLPKIKSSPDSSNICEYAALTKCIAKPLTAPCGLAWSTAQRVSRCLLPQSSSAPRHVDVPPLLQGHSVPLTQAQAGNFSPHNSQISALPRIPARENLWIISRATRNTLWHLPLFVPGMESLFKYPFEGLVNPRESAHLSWTG